MKASKKDESGSAVFIVEEAINPSRLSRPAMIIRGLLAIIIGLCLFFAPVSSMVGIIMAIGILLIIDAVLILATALSAKGKIRSAGIFYGILMLLVGIISLASPLLTGWVWMVMLGVWQLIAGFNMLTCTAPSCNRGWVWFSGLLSILTGILFIVWPITGMAAFAWVTGIMLIVSGMSLLLAPLFTPGKE